MPHCGYLLTSVPRASPRRREPTVTVPTLIDNAVLIPAGAIMVLLLGGLILVGVLWWHGARKRGAETQRLQHLVEERTRELASLSSHLQQVAENEKQHLARELH